MKSIALRLAIALAVSSLASAQRIDAWVLERAAKYASGPLAQALRRAGFAVRALPLQRSPAELRGLIALGSWSSEAAGYSEWVRAQGGDLHSAIQGGSVLLQLVQADQVEKTPPFLPPDLPATRADEDCQVLRVLRPDAI